MSDPGASAGRWHAADAGRGATHAMSWTDGPLLGFDTETTGVDVDTDRIVTAALVRRDARRHARPHLADRPRRRDPRGGGRHPRHHAPSTPATHGRPPREALEEIAADARRGPAAAASRSSPTTRRSTCRLLDAELRRHGLPTLPRPPRPRRPARSSTRSCSTAPRTGTGAASASSSTCAATTQVVESGDLHTADVDVVATLDVLERDRRAVPAPGRRSTSTTLHDVPGRRAHQAWAESFNAWRAEQGLDGPGASDGVADAGARRHALVRRSSYRALSSTRTDAHGSDRFDDAARRGNISSMS